MDQYRYEVKGKSMTSKERGKIYEKFPDHAINWKTSEKSYAIESLAKDGSFLERTIFEISVNRKLDAVHGLDSFRKLQCRRGFFHEIPFHS